MGLVFVLAPTAYRVLQKVKLNQKIFSCYLQDAKTFPKPHQLHLQC